MPLIQLLQSGTSIHNQFLSLLTFAHFEPPAGSVIGTNPANFSNTSLSLVHHLVANHLFTELIFGIISSPARHLRLVGSLSPLSSGPVVANRSLAACQKHRAAATTLLQMGYPDGPGRHHPLSANLRPLPQRKTRRPHGGRRLGSPCQEGVEASRDAWQRHRRRTRTVA